eukprot:TRINITY_DN75851_c0_g1_i1.p1 TRINITY_DN75851_c0_g1~~TRINITY_DN75851_c0_g1_i1.p1  ORF type:complete len:474 (-),score=90.83 TRINITY_DN75851_c0_g1_i1:210-1631(-)
MHSTQYTTQARLRGVIAGFTVRIWIFCAIALLMPALVQAGSKDYYSLLGVSKKADDKQLKRAYKKKAMVWHPDKHPTNKEKATAKFQEIAHAYETLSDPEKRRLYDLGGEEALKGGGASSPDASNERRGPNGAQTSFQHHGEGNGPEVDPKIFAEAFQKMFAQQAASGGKGFNFGGMPKDSGYTFSFGGAPHDGSHDKVKKSAKQGGPLFTSTKVHEVSFEDHEAQINALRQQGHVLVLFYASGGKKCPEDCHRIRNEYLKLAKSRQQLRMAAVQCKRRRGMCSEFADRLPTLVLYAKASKRRHILTSGASQAASSLSTRLDKALLDLDKVQELTPELFRRATEESGVDFCDGLFCLLLLERGPRNLAQASRAAVMAAAKKLANEPVRIFFVRADDHADFARAFEGASPASQFMKKFRQLPVVQAILLRPKRKRFELFEGNPEDAAALADFVSETIARGTPLMHEVKGAIQMS